MTASTTVAADTHPLKSSSRGLGGNPQSPRKTAIVQIVIPTAVQPEPDAASVAESLRSNTADAAQRAAVIDTLGERGWTLERVEHVATDIDYVDLIIDLRKDFASEDGALADARDCGATVDLNFSFGWNYTGQRDENGQLDVEWWTEC